MSTNTYGIIGGLPTGSGNLFACTITNPTNLNLSGSNVYSFPAFIYDTVTTASNLATLNTSTGVVTVHYTGTYLLCASMSFTGFSDSTSPPNSLQGVLYVNGTRTLVMCTRQGSNNGCYSFSGGILASDTVLDLTLSSGNTIGMGFDISWGNTSSHSMQERNNINSVLYLTYMG